MPNIRTAAGKGAALNPTEADSDMKRPAIAQGSNYNLTGSHNREFHELAAGVIATLPTAASSLTETGDWECTFKAVGATSSTINRNGQTIDGLSENVILPPNSSVTVIMNAAFNGFYLRSESRRRRKGCLAYKTVNQPLTTPSQWADVLWEAEVYDTDAIHSVSANTHLFVVPSWATMMKVICNMSFEEGNGVRALRLVTSAGVPTVPLYQNNQVAQFGFSFWPNITTSYINVTPGSSYKIQGWQGDTVTRNILANDARTWCEFEFFP